MPKSTNLKPLSERITKTHLKLLQKRKMTNAEGAEHYNVCETYFSRTVAAMQQKEPSAAFAARKAAHKLNEERKHHRERLAKSVVRKQLSFAKAVERANCSERTMRRYVEMYGG